MGLKSKMYLRYEINDPPNMVNPNDTLSGTLYIESQDKKDKKIKKLFIDCVELYEEYVKSEDADGNVSWDWVNQKKQLKRYELTAGEKIKSGDTKKYKWEIQLPSSWSRKKSDKEKGWHMALHFKQKTGMKASLGANKNDATCVLPVKHSKASPSFGSLKKDKSAPAAAAPAAAGGGGDMKFCSSCGKKVKKEAKFCEHCGSPC